MKKHMAALTAVLSTLFIVLLTINGPTAATAETTDTSSLSTMAAGPTVIGVDGTTVNRSIPILSDIIGLFLDNVLSFNHGEYLALPGYNVVMNDYPRSFGLLTLGGPNYDSSVAKGVAGAVSYIKLAQDGDSSVPVKLVCLSQGSDVCTQTNEQLFRAGYDQSNVTYILLGNVTNADGGLKVRIPRLGNGIFIPGPGVTLGTATPPIGSDAKIIQVSYEYDGFARAPEYLINVLAVLNAMVGTLLEHGDYRNADPYAPENIVSTTPDGRITNIVIPVDELPLLTVARFLGLPRVVADIIRPALKAIIDTAYSQIPEGEGNYPTEAVPFKLLPSPAKFQTDLQNVMKGFKESGDRLLETLSLRTATSPAHQSVPAPADDKLTEAGGAPPAPDTTESLSTKMTPTRNSDTAAEDSAVAITTEVEAEESNPTSSITDEKETETETEVAKPKRQSTRLSKPQRLSGVSNTRSMFDMNDGNEESKESKPFAPKPPRKHSEARLSVTVSSKADNTVSDNDSHDGDLGSDKTSTPSEP